MTELGIDGVFKLTDELLQHELSQRHLPTDGERSDMQVSTHFLLQHFTTSSSHRW